jgi:hypothetical protein
MYELTEDTVKYSKITSLLVLVGVTNNLSAILEVL